MSPVTRREVLLSGGVLALAGTGWGVNSRALRRHRDEALRALTASLHDAGRLTEAGEIYLAKHPNEDHIGRLDALILPDLGPLGWRRRLEATQRDFTARVTEDFRTGDLVELEGWQYSRTEARFAARVALSQRQSL